MNYECITYCNTLLKGVNFLNTGVSVKNSRFLISGVYLNSYYYFFRSALCQVERVNLALHVAMVGYK